MSEEPGANRSHISRRTVIRLQCLETVDVLRIGVSCTNELSEALENLSDGGGDGRDQGRAKRSQSLLGGLGGQRDGPRGVPLERRISNVKKRKSAHLR